MKVFHLFAVFPAGINADGINQVRHYDFTVVAGSLQEAWNEIRDIHIPVNPDAPRAYGEELTTVSQASEVWGYRYGAGTKTISCPDTKRNQWVDFPRHCLWSQSNRSVGPYQLVHISETSLQKHFDGVFARYFEERHGTPATQDDDAGHDGAGEAELSPGYGQA